MTGNIAWNRGKHWSEEVKLKLSNSQKLRFVVSKHPFLGKKHSPETRKKMSEAKKNFKGSIGERNGMFGNHHSEESKKKISERCRRGVNHPNYGIHLPEEIRNKISISVRETIKKDPTIIRKMLSCSRPNHRELQLQSILDTLYPEQWKYVGDGSFIINGKNPDFINCNGKKLIIELFGEHWHERGEEETRKNIFREYGYDTLIIWAKELNKKE